MKIVRIIEICSKVDPVLVVHRASIFEREYGIKIRFSSLNREMSYQKLRKARVQLFEQALYENDTAAILVARGGYGSSDLLPLLPWHRLADLDPKLLIGFSDVSAIHSAFWSQLGWIGIHGPMPGSHYWPQGRHDDVKLLAELVLGVKDGTSLKGLHPFNEMTPSSDFVAKPESGLEKVEHFQGTRGWLFGGCFSVLTNLIGTPYFPKTLEGAILFFEDINEPMGRLIRQLNQWSQNRLFERVNGVVLGTFNGTNDKEDWDRGKSAVAEIISQYAPVWVCEGFGHCCPNLPLGIGAQAVINCKESEWVLSWEKTSGFAPVQ